MPRFEPNLLRALLALLLPTTHFLSSAQQSIPFQPFFPFRCSFLNVVFDVFKRAVLVLSFSSCVARAISLLSSPSVAHLSKSLSCSPSTLLQGGSSSEVALLPGLIHALATIDDGVFSLALLDPIDDYKISL